MFKPEMIAGLIRHALTTIGGGFVASGVASSSEIEAIAGGVAALIGVVWSFVAKRNKP